MRVGQILTRSERANPHRSRVEVGPNVVGQRSSLATVEAMARLATQTASVSHVGVPRAPHVVESAHAIARNAGVHLTVDLMAFTVGAQFDGTRTQ
jgi:hypothetical protein